MNASTLWGWRIDSTGRRWWTPGSSVEIGEMAPELSALHGALRIPYGARYRLFDRFSGQVIGPAFDTLPEAQAHAVRLRRDHETGGFYFEDEESAGSEVPPA